MLFVCSALVWGTSVKHCPQKVGKEHILNDEDVVQILKKSVVIVAGLRSTRPDPLCVSLSILHTHMHTHSHTHTHIHTHTYTHLHTLSHTFSLCLSLTVSNTHSFSVSSFMHTHSLSSLSLWRALSLSHTHIHTHTLSLAHLLASLLPTNIEQSDYHSRLLFFGVFFFW